MIVKDIYDRKSCLFCASDYHLEMILLPYICDKINEETIIITQENLEESLQLVLDRINIDKKIKEKVLRLGWKGEDCSDKIKGIINNIEKNLNYRNKLNIIINGDYNYIEEKNKEISEIFLKYEYITIVNCYHVGDLNVNIDELRKKYVNILNTRKI